MPSVPAFDHIVVVVMENHGVNQIIGNSTSAPYINSLLPQAAYFSQSFAIRHPSSPSYLAMFSGSVQGVNPPPDLCPPAGAPFNAPNLASNLIAAGKTFGEYAQSIPSNPLDCTSAIYDPNHVPVVRFANLPGSPPGTALLHNFTTFPTTAGGFAALPTVAWVTPDGNNSMESSSTAPAAIVQGDNFLRNSLPAYITWAQSNNSLLILTWDEDQGFLNGNGGSPTGGGHVVTMFLGAHVTPGTYPESSISASVGVAGIDSYNVLRTIEDSLSLSHAGAAASATPITDCWGTVVTGGQFDHIVVCIEENQFYGSMIGNSTLPYINNLASQGASMINAFGGIAGSAATGHPSFPNYMMLFSGAVQGTFFGTGGDACPPAHQPYATPNLYTALTAVGKTFAEFAEGTPSNPATCAAGNYVGRHCPAAWFSNVPSSISKDFSLFPTTPAGFATLPTVSFVIPNLQDDMHTGSPQQGDTWLSTHMDPYVQWAKTNNSLFILTWDEDDSQHNNQIATIFVGAKVIPGQYSDLFFHTNLLATICNAYGAAPPGAAATAAPVTDIFSTGGGGDAALGGISWAAGASPWTSVSATFTVPALSGDTGANMSIWVALSSSANSTPPQQLTGIFCAYDTTKPGNNRVQGLTSGSPGTEYWLASSYPVAAGDSLTLTVRQDAAYYYFTQANATQHWSYTEQKALDAIALTGSGFSASALAAPSHAWVIIRKEGGADLPNYGSLAFAVTGSPAMSSGTPTLITTQNSTVDQTPSSFINGSFTLTWKGFR